MPNNAARGRNGAPLHEVEYVPAGPTVQAFHDDPSFVRCLLGPYGSGKSSACIMELIWRAGQQAPGPDGIRHSRFAIVRSTYPQLKTTTLRSFEQWVPAAAGHLNSNPPMVFRMQRGDIDAEFLFLAMETEADIAKLTSMELSGAWINEAKEVPQIVFTTLKARVGRYPSKNQGGTTRPFVILDSNPPDDTSWLFSVFETERPEGHRIFKQPSGMSPHAENLKNLTDGQEYYRRMMVGADESWCRANVHGEYSHVTEGKAVYHNFRERSHVAREPLQAIPGLPLLVGADLGRTPAAVIGQRLANSRWLILAEVVMDDAGMVRFGQALTAFVRQNYPDHKVAGMWIDPAGTARGHDDKSDLDILNEVTGWRVRPAAPNNDWTMRLEAVLGMFNRMVDGDSGVLTSPSCGELRKACRGGYQYKLLKTSTGLAYDERPLKNGHSHIGEALQYLALGAGEADVVLNKVKRARRKPTANSADYDVFDRTYGHGRRDPHQISDAEFYSIK